MKRAILIIMLLAAAADARVMERDRHITATPSTSTSTTLEVRYGGSYASEGFIPIAETESIIPQWLSDLTPQMPKIPQMPEIKSQDFGFAAPMLLILATGAAGVYTLGKSIRYLEARLNQGGGNVIK